MDRTGISWANAGLPIGSTWNPTYGCDVCSPGCKNCYAMRIAGRFSGPGKPYEGLITFGKNKKAVWNGEGFLKASALLQPLKWREPRGVFVDSMSDLFFEKITDEEIAACFGVMAAAHQHRYIILTKRAKRMRAWYEWMERFRDGHGAWGRGAAAINFDHRALTCWQNVEAKSTRVVYSTWATDFWNRAHLVKWPMPHIWQGVSVDTRKHGLPRIDELRETPAAVRLLSIEPLLEDLGDLDLTGIHWVIIGCESGPGARVCDPAWIRRIIEQCRAQGVPVWLKQAEHTPGKFLPGYSATLEVGADTGSKNKGPGPAGGRIVELPYLDGKQYAEWPTAVAA